jgi:acyl-coenzyme A thioesterase PaaI-like protein
LSLTHHELCFGCGSANLFGLQLDLERDGEDGVSGRFFVKQDHQGPPGVAHGGILASALDDAMALVLHSAGIHAYTRRLEVDFHSPAPVGAFVEVDARIEAREGPDVRLRATARAQPGDDRLADAAGTFRVVEDPAPLG